MGFFLAGPPGRRDPAAELMATIGAFFAPAPTGDPRGPDTATHQHAQCAFPARYSWLKQALGIDSLRLPDQPCPLYDEWRGGIAPQAVTLAYATAFLNSPASMYGHTFLRVSRATGEGNPLLDYIINFAADVDTNNGLVYAVKGVSGGFRGLYYVLPYYLKVQEYSNMESRDLFEYELSLSREQVERMVAHTWEMRNTHFDYYFFSRNCSYQLLTLLEVADPNLHLIDGFGARVIPADTVRAVLAQPGLVRRVRSRPSLRTVMARRKSVLTRREIRVAEGWMAAGINGPAPAAADLPKNRHALVLDAAYDFARYKDGFRAEPTDDFKKRERRLLLARGRLGVPPQDVVTLPAIAAPEKGHATLRLGLMGGFSNQGGLFETLAVRGALHDYLDSGAGYAEDATLEMAHLRLRFDNDTRALRLDKIDVVNIVSAAPLDSWIHSFSWKAWIGADNARELGCERPHSDRAGWRCLYGGFTTGGGFAARTGARERALFYLLATTDVGAGPAFAGPYSYRVGAGGEAGFVGEVGARWRFEMGSRYIYYFLGDRTRALRGYVTQAFSLARGIDVRFGANIAGTYAEITAGLFGYL